MSDMRFRHEVDVVVVTADDPPGWADATVRSALGSVGVDVRVWVIDNGSNPPAAVAPDPRTKVYRNQKDLGVAAARNQGVRVGQAPFVCLLDSASRLHPNTLAALAGALQDDPKLGLVGPVLDRRSADATAGRVPTLLRLVARVRRRAPDSIPDDRREVDWVSGACQVFGRQAFNYVGGFDEWNLLRAESVDFCLRIREAGLRVQQVTSVSCGYEPETRAERSVRWLDTLVVGFRHLARRPSAGPAAARRASRAAVGRS